MTGRIVFRVDASLKMGTGHVMRCLTLADALRDSGKSCHFICRDHPGGLEGFIRKQGYEVSVLPVNGKSGHLVKGSRYSDWLGADWELDVKDVLAVIGRKKIDWLIVDHYGIDASWEGALRPFCKKIMVIDDLADRYHVCDLLLDQNLGRFADDYRELLPSNAISLVGSDYAILRKEFPALREESLVRRTKLKFRNLLISMGGVDQDNMTGRILDAIKSCVLPQDLRITVVMGPHAPWLKSVMNQSAIMPWRTQVIIGANNMAELMLENDLAIGAAGITAWERCCLGLPTLLLVLADNQLQSAMQLQSAEAAIVIPTQPDMERVLKKYLRKFSLAPYALRMMSEAAFRIVDGNGVRRVMQSMNLLSVRCTG